MQAELTLHFETQMDGEREQTTLFAAGQYVPTFNGKTVQYTEEIDGAQTDVTVFVSGHRAEIRRRGGAQVCFILEPNAVHECPYQTPYGTLSMTVKNAQVTDELGADGGRLTLRYTLEMGGGESEHTMTMDIRKV